MKNGYGKIKTFLCSDCSEMLNCNNPSLESGNYDSSSYSSSSFWNYDLIQKARNKSETVGNLFKKHKKSYRKMYVTSSTERFCVGNCTK